MIERALYLCYNQQQHNVTFSGTAPDRTAPGIVMKIKWYKVSKFSAKGLAYFTLHISVSLAYPKGSEIRIWKTWKCLYRRGSLRSRQNSATTGHVLFVCLYFILNLSKHFLWRDLSPFPSSSKKANLFQESIHPILSH